MVARYVWCSVEVVRVVLGVSWNDRELDCVKYGFRVAHRVITKQMCRIYILQSKCGAVQYGVTAARRGPELRVSHCPYVCEGARPIN